MMTENKRAYAKLNPYGFYDPNKRTSNNSLTSNYKNKDIFESKISNKHIRK